MLSSRRDHRDCSLNNRLKWWGSALHRGLELTLSDLLAGWQEAVAYKGTESRNIAGGRVSHTTWVGAPLDKGPLCCFPGSHWVLGSQTPSCCRCLAPLGNWRDGCRDGSALPRLCVPGDFMVGRIYTKQACTLEGQGMIH